MPDTRMTICVYSSKEERLIHYSVLSLDWVPTIKCKVANLRGYCVLSILFQITCLSIFSLCDNASSIC